MNFTKLKIQSASLILLLTLLHILWDYNHGSVPSHNLFANKDLPAVSNWWGILSLPLLTWFSITRIEKRPEINQNKIIKRIALGLVVALSIGMTFLFDIKDVPYMILVGIVITGFLFPIYFSEYFLGFVIGLAYFFGGILPIFIGTVLLCITSFSYHVVEIIGSYFSKK